MKGDHSKIHGREDAVEYYTPAYIIEPVRRVLGSIDYDPASSELANSIVKATRYSSDPGYIDYAPDWGDGIPHRHFAGGGLTEVWRGKIWLNHPFGRDEKKCNPFCSKKICQSRGYHIASYKDGSYSWIYNLVNLFRVGETKRRVSDDRIIAAATITFTNTDAAWFHLLMKYPQVFLYRRVTFMVERDGELVKSGGSSKGAAITFLGVPLDRIYDNFKELGELKIPYGYYDRYKNE